MKYKLIKILCACFFLFGMVNTAAAVDFRITTDKMCNDDYFYFTLSAAGNYQVTCEKGTLYSSNCSGTVSGSNINKSGNTQNCLYYCKFSRYSTFTSCKAREIDFTLQTAPTAYNSGYSTISFYAFSGSPNSTNDTYQCENAAHIDGISVPDNGSSPHGFAKLFPYKGTSSGYYPMFIDTFRCARNLTSIDNTYLFDGYSMPGNNMFQRTFYGCNNLRTVPSGVFSSISGTSGSANYMFDQTFYGCSSLTLSSGLTFNLKLGGNYMFNQTFYGCTNLQSMPTQFFSTSVSGYLYMFKGTFQNAMVPFLPSNLFANITSAANYMFQQTFNGASGTNTYIPPSFFSNLIANGSPNANGTLMSNTFASSNIATTCPSGTAQYITNYESYWSGKVSCQSTSNQLTVSYNCNGGTGAPVSGTTFSGAYYTTASNSCTRPGYSLKNSGAWAVGGASSTNTLSQNTSVRWTYGSTTLVAQWTPNTIALTWDGGGTPTSCTYGNTFTVPTPAARTGYVFTGWKVQ